MSIHGINTATQTHTVLKAKVFWNILVSLKMNEKTKWISSRTEGLSDLGLRTDSIAYTCTWEGLILEHCFSSASMKVVSARSMEQRETFIYKTKFNGAASAGLSFMKHLVLCLTICGSVTYANA